MERSPSSSKSPSKRALERARLTFRTMKTIALSLLWVGLASSVSAGDRLAEVLTEMETAGNALKTLSATFTQTDHDFILEDEEKSTGTLYVELPGRIRWEYAPPAEKVLLVKGDLVRVYNPVAAQVQEFDRKSGGSGGGMDLLVGFGGGNDDIAKNYDATLLGETPEHVTLKLIPKQHSQASIFASIELTVDKKTWTPTRSVFHEFSRDRTDIAFEKMAINEKLPDGAFELDLPPNVEIVRD